jgi:TonB family protein
MMKLWIENYAKSTPVIPGAVLSVLTHVVLIGGAVAATATPDTANQIVPEVSLARFLLPPSRVGQQPQREMIRYVAVSVPVGAFGPAQSIEEIKPAEAAVLGPDPIDALALPELKGLDSVFSMIEVDSVATRHEWSAAPAYPPRMLEQKSEGFVRAQWVVQANGYADTTSLQIIESTHDDFSKAVRDALPFMRFSPAKIGRKAVSQLVQQEFTFRIRNAPDTSKARRPAS